MNDINNNLRLFVLNIPELLDLRTEVNTLKAETDKPEEVSEQVARAIENVVEEGIDNADIPYMVESAIENYDFSDAVESALDYGYIDITSKVDGGDIDIESNSAVTSLEERIEKIESDLEDGEGSANAEYVSALEQTIDSLTETVQELESALDSITNRLDNASINI